MTNLLYKIGRLRYESVENEPPELMNTPYIRTTFWILNCGEERLSRYE